MVKECEDTQTHTSTKLKTQQLNFETIFIIFKQKQ